MLFIRQLVDGPPTAKTSIPRVDRRIGKLWNEVKCTAAGGVSVSYRNWRGSIKHGQDDVEQEVGSAGGGGVDTGGRRCRQGLAEM